MHIVYIYFSKVKEIVILLQKTLIRILIRQITGLTDAPEIVFRERSIV